MGSSPAVSEPASAGVPASAESANGDSDPKRVTLVCPTDVPKHLTEGLAPGRVLFARVTYTPA